MDEAALASVEEADLMFARRGCCCFWVPHFRSRQMAPAGAGGMWERIGRRGTPAAEATFSDGPWWQRVLMRVREWSEIVAGPRWKTFIRRFNRNNRWVAGGCGGGGGGEGGSGGGRGGGARLGKFHYDPLSYALNFDDGHSQDGEDDGDYGCRNFSARYVLPASLPRNSMDLAGT